MSRILKLIFLLAGFYCISCQAMLELELTQGVDSAIPIAMIAFAGGNAVTSADNQITNIITNDLNNSGRFRISASQDHNPGDYGFWQEQKFDNVISGQIKKISGSNFQVKFQLYDVYNQAKLLDQQFTVNEKQLRRLGHHISDLIYAQLTGDRGVFATKIVYVLVEHHEPKANNYKLEIADIDGFNPKTLLSSRFPLMSPAWSPDGTHIAYVSFEGNRASIYSQNVVSGERTLVSHFPGINGAPAWSPDGKKLALVLTPTGYPKIYVLDIASGKLDQLTSEWYLDTEPNWAPDGNSLIFTSDRGGNPQLYQVNIASKKVTRLTYDGKYNARGEFTPDGKNIVMLHQEGDNFNIAVQDLKTGRLRVLTNSGFDESPSVAPNGKMVAYATNANDRGVLALVSVDGKVKILLPAREGEVQEPAWSPFQN